jgi:hypothetical protein
MLVARTARGRSVYAAAVERQEPWAARLAKSCRIEQIAAATAVLERLRSRLEEDSATRDE